MIVVRGQQQPFRCPRLVRSRDTRTRHLGCGDETKSPLAAKVADSAAGAVQKGHTPCAHEPCLRKGQDERKGCVFVAALAFEPVRVRLRGVGADAEHVPILREATLGTQASGLENLHFQGRSLHDGTPGTQAKRKARVFERQRRMVEGSFRPEGFEECRPRKLRFPRWSRTVHDTTTKAAKRHIIAQGSDV